MEHRFLQIFKYMGLSVNEIRPEASFKDDFEFEEFQFGYLLFYLGSYFKISISDSEYVELKTIGSTMDFVKRKLQIMNHLKISRREICPATTLKSIPRNACNKPKPGNFSIFPPNLYLFHSNSSLRV